MVIVIRLIFFSLIVPTVVIAKELITHTQLKEGDTGQFNMSSKFRGQGSGGQQSGASSGASREANLKQRKNSTNQGSKSSGGTDKSKPHDEGGDVPHYTKPSFVSTVTVSSKVRLLVKCYVYYNCKVWHD